MSVTLRSNFYKRLSNPAGRLWLVKFHCDTMDERCDQSSLAFDTLSDQAQDWNDEDEEVITGSAELNRGR